MSVHFVKINNEEIAPDPVANEPDQGRGQALFPGSRFPNVYIIGRKGSGKSVVVEHIFKTYFTNLSQKERDRLQILVFCANAFKDRRWKSILEWCKKQKLNVKVRRSMSMDKDEMKEAAKQQPPYQGQDFLEWFVHRQKYTREPDKDEDTPIFHLFFDDMTKATRSVPFSELAATNRNKKDMVVTCSQNLMFLNKDAREQQDFCLLFRGLDEGTLAEIHNFMGLPMDLEDFSDIYHEVTDDRTEHNFLHCCRDTGNLRMNFDMAIEYAEQDPALKESAGGNQPRDDMGRASHKRARDYEDDDGGGKRPRGMYEDYF